MDIFYALAEPTRRNILEILASNGKLSASEIYKQFRVSAAAISQHLKVLREANVVIVEKQAQQRIYQINTEAMIELEFWAKRMSVVWNDRLDRLEKVLKEERQKKI